jgi:hypothetical protein
MRCPTCGVEAVEQAVYCHKCGERLNPAGGSFAESPRPAEQPASAPAEASLPAAAVRPQAPDQPEQELWRGGYSPKAMLGGWAISAAISLALLIGAIVWARSTTSWLILSVLIVAPWLYCYAVSTYRHMSVRYVLTTQRFIHESGILRRVNNRVEVLDMDDIKFEQDLLERLAGVGTIRILSHDRSDPELALPGIENVQAVAGLFDDARLAERRRRGLHVEQI